MNFVLVQNLITKLLIHMSQRQSAVEWNAPCLFLFKIYLPRNIKLHINEKIMTEIYKSNSDHYAIHKIYASCNILKNNGAVGGTILPEVVSCLTANPQLPALWSIFAYDPHSDTKKKVMARKLRVCNSHSYKYFYNLSKQCNSEAISNVTLIEKMDHRIVSRHTRVVIC